MSATKTPWFYAWEDDPVRIGAYEFGCPMGSFVTTKLRWDGRSWRQPDNGIHVPCLKCRWRGLARVREHS